MSSHKRISGLDVLRAAAVLMVVFYHYPKAPEQMVLRALTHTGWTGVDLFFVLSGFLIGGQLFESMKNEAKSTSLWVFYARRFLRTLPNYYVVLGVVALVLGFGGRGSFLNYKYLIFIQNFGVPPEFSQSWSLCVEEHFYVFFPLLVFAMRPYLRRISAVQAVFFAIVVLAVQSVVRAWIWYKIRPDHLALQNVDSAFEKVLGHIFYPTYTRLDGLTLGVVMAFLKVFHTSFWKALQKSWKLVLSVSSVVLVLALGLTWNKLSLGSNSVGYALLAVSYAGLLVPATAPGSWLNRVQIPGVSVLARLSYAMYLTHTLALEAAYHACQYVGASTTGPAMFVFSVVLVMTFAGILYKTVEKPFLVLRDRIL